MQNFYKSLVLTVMALLGFAGAASAQTLSIDVANITPGNAEITVTPSQSDVKFYCAAYTAEEYAQYSAQEGGIVGRQIANWKRMADLYGEDWTTTMSYTLQSGTYSSTLASMFGAAITPDTDYTVVAFGMTAAGEVSAPLMTANVHTAAAKVSANTIGITVNKVWVSSAPEAAVRLSASVSVTPSNTDPYTVYCLEDRYLTKYDLTTPEGLKQMAQEQVLPYAKKFYTAKCDTTFAAMRKDRNFYVIAVGIEDGALTTVPVIANFRTEVPVAAFTLEVSNPTCIDAHVKITPANPDQQYHWGVTTQAAVDLRAEGNPANIDLVDKAWYDMLADLYGCDWESFSLQFSDTGAKEGSYRELNGSDGQLASPLDWNTHHYLYAYTIDEAGHRNSDVYYVEFNTLPREVIDTNFEMTVKSVEKAADGTMTATIHVVPQDVTMNYAVCMFDAKYYDFYVGKEEYTMEDYWMHQVYESLQGPFVGERDFRYTKCKAGKAYAFNVMGIGDEIPNTDCFVLRFVADEQTAVSELASTFAVTGAEGRIEIEGDYTTAAVYATDGTVAAALRGETAAYLPAGIYIVKAQTPAGVKTVKVIVK